MRHSLSLSTTPVFSFTTATAIKESEVFSGEGPLGPYDPNTGIPEEQIEPTAFNATPEMTGGTFYLTPFVDYALEVSEYIEPNNWTLYDTDVPIMVKLTIEGSLDIFNGLKSPLAGSTYYANSGSVVPLAWQYMDPADPEMVIDSSNPLPVITFSGWTEEGVTCSNYKIEPDPDFTFQTVEDPGSSGLRYVEGVWQFNWQTKWPDADPDYPVGDPLPEGCYEIMITRDPTCAGQGDGPFLVQLN